MRQLDATIRYGITYACVSHLCHVFRSQATDMLDKKRQTEQSLRKLKRGAAKEGDDSGPSEADRIQQQVFLDVM